MKANDVQHGGDHYGSTDVQHWDFTWLHQYNQFEYCATKYVERCWLKNGLEDLNKALHHLCKYEELLGGNPSFRSARTDQQAIDYLRTRDLTHEQRVIFIHIHVGEIRTAIECLELYIADKAA